MTGHIGCRQLPRVIFDSEKKEYPRFSPGLRPGIREALVVNLGHQQYAKGIGFQVRGDFGLNIFTPRR
jgi:hypothetical protein